MEEYTELNGTIDSVVYRNDENGYAVIRMTLDDGDSATVVGCFPCVAPGEAVSAEGSWMLHNQHGRQFKAEHAIRLLPTNADDIYKYLAGGTVRGIGPATAALIVNRFGEKALDVLELHPDKLAEIKGISTSKASEMSKSFKRQAGLRRLMEFLCGYRIRPEYALRLYKFYGNSAMETLQENPYILASSHIGAAFSDADALALEMGVENDSINRIAAAVLFELRHNLGNGHCFIPKEKLTAATSQLIGVDTERIEEGVELLKENGEIVCDMVANLEACYLKDIYEAESYTARRIKAMCKPVPTSKMNLDRFIADLEKKNGISYAPLQKSTLSLAMSSNIMVITGGPGTGKTTVVKAIIELFKHDELKVCLAAPTGRAAKRMTELTGEEASTVHRLLGAKISDDGEALIFTKNEDDPLNADAVILDECSMMDITLMKALISAMRPECKLVLVGDADQLPPVGPGNVFADIIRSNIVPTVRLTEIFRQKAESRIVSNAHKINKGEHPNFEANTGDFFRLRRLRAESSIDTVLELCERRLPNNMGIPTDEIQVLSPTRKGETGTVSLNRLLQAALNPKSDEKKEKSFGDIVFREGDRIMQIKNNYDIPWQSSDGVFGSGIFNGDLGRIKAIDHQNETMKIEFDDKTVTYGFDMLSELEHSWAMTVHKSQGSEYRAVILVLNSGTKMLMTRSVLYTAVTRAKSLLIMVGDDSIAHYMIDNNRQSRRYSALRIRLADENT